jgi:hypothetical protein
MGLVVMIPQTFADIIFVAIALVSGGVGFALGWVAHGNRLERQIRNEHRK